MMLFPVFRNKTYILSVREEVTTPQTVHQNPVVPEVHSSGQGHIPARLSPQ